MVSREEDKIKLDYYFCMFPFAVEFPFHILRQMEQRISFYNSVFFPRVHSGVSLSGDGREERGQENREGQVIASYSNGSFSTYVSFWMHFFFPEED